MQYEEEEKKIIYAIVKWEIFFVNLSLVYAFGIRLNVMSIYLHFCYSQNAISFHFKLSIPLKCFVFCFNFISS